MKNNLRLKNVKIEDLCPSILARMGCRIPEGLDGKVIAEAFYTREPSGQVSRQSVCAKDTSENAYTQDEEDAVSKRLRNLGYI